MQTFVRVVAGDELWGYIDRQGNVVIVPRFERAGFFENGGYPFITTLYAVTVKDDTDPDTRILLDRLTGDTAQKLLADSGYVGFQWSCVVDFPGS